MSKNNGKLAPVEFDDIKIDGESVEQMAHIRNAFGALHDIIVSYQDTLPNFPKNQDLANKQFAMARTHLKISLECVIEGLRYTGEIEK